MEFKIYLSNLGKYNEGELMGKWVNLPCNDIEEELAEIGVIPNTQYGEYSITAYENDWDYAVEEYEDLWELNELAERLADIDSNGDGDWLAAYMEAEGCELEYALDHYADSIFYQGEDLESVAYDLVHECYDLPEIALRYFDYEAFIRDLRYDGYAETSYGVICP